MPVGDRRRDGAGPAAHLGRVAVGVAVLLLVLTGLVVSGSTWLAAVDGAVGRPAFELTRHHGLLRAWWSFDASAERPDVFRALLLVGAGALWWARRRWSAGWVLLSLALSEVAAPVLKVVVDRPRPVWPDPIMVLDDPSFPSGHATAAWVAATAVVLACRDGAVPRRWRRALATLAVGAALVVSLDRVLLGVHHPSDVVGGLLLGVLVTLVSRLLVDRARRAVGRHAERTPRRPDPVDGRATGATRETRAR